MTSGALSTRRPLSCKHISHELVQARPGGPRGYHHGNLKEALIRAALELIAQKGSAGFTFAEAARRAGVSPAAPYRHFHDRDELLANVARRGFEAFEQTLARAWDNGRPDPMTALDRLGKAYLAFARKEPAYYSAMFEGGVSQGASPDLEACGERAFGILRSAAESPDRRHADAGAPARADDRAAYLGAVARDRLAVWARRRWAPAASDDARGTVGGRRACLSPGPRNPGDQRARTPGPPGAQAVLTRARRGRTGNRVAVIAISSLRR